MESDTHNRNPYKDRNPEEIREKVMKLVNHYRTPNIEDLANRCEAIGMTGNIGSKNYNVNKLRLFKDIPDGIEILIDYVDVTAIRMLDIPSEIIYESIYRKLPELFEE